MKRYTILISFWSIFAPGVGLLSAARKILAGSTLAQVLSEYCINNEPKVRDVKQLAEKHIVYIIVDPKVSELVHGAVQTYLNDLGLGLGVVWTGGAEDILAMTPYDFIVDSGETTCYHTVVVVPPGKDICECVDNYDWKQEQVRLRREQIAHQRRQKTLGELVDLRAAF